MLTKKTKTITKISEIPKQKKQSKLRTLINTTSSNFCLHITYQIKEKQTQLHQEIQETIQTDTKATTTSPPAQSSCRMKITYMLNVKRLMLLSSYKKYINLFKTY